MGMVVVVTSGKGGAGKSTVAAGLGAAVCRRGRSVLLLDMDQGLRCLDLMLGVSAQPVFVVGDLLKGRCTAADAVLRVPGCDGLYVLPAPPEAGAVDSIEAMKTLACKLSPVFDAVLVDSPAGIGRGFCLSAQAATGALVVATPDPVCVRDGAVTARLLRQMGVSESRLVINRFQPRLIREGLLPDFDEMIDAVGLQLVGAVPDDPAVLAAAARGEPLTAGPAARAFDRIALRLEGKDEPLPPLHRLS